MQLAISFPGGYLGGAAGGGPSGRGIRPGRRCMPGEPGTVPGGLFCADEPGGPYVGIIRSLPFIFMFYIINGGRISLRDAAIRCAAKIFRDFFYFSCVFRERVIRLWSLRKRIGIMYVLRNPLLFWRYGSRIIYVQNNKKGGKRNGG